MHCSKCGTENPEGMKFCGQCTAPLALICPKCQFQNPPGFKFCGQCTAALTSPVPARPSAGADRERSDGDLQVAERVRVQPPTDSPIDGERKTVTALFADIKGSMELMEDLDPEEARAIVDPALKLMIDAAHRYDGYIVQSTGDGIFALFGAPLAHEDHPQRALYAALRMQEELRRYSDRMRHGGSLPIQVRVGVNTGEVVVRTIKTDDAHTEYTPIGHSTSLASRMQALAPIGSIAITEPVASCARATSFSSRLGPTKVKGVSEPVNVYEVTGLGPLRTRLQRSAGRGLTKFVGRQREMDAMKHAAEQAKAGHGQIVAAMAEAGVGKSRLFYEFKAVSQSGWHGARSFLGLAWKGFGIPAGDRSAAWSYFEITQRRRRAHAAREDQRQNAHARSFAGGRAAVSVRVARSKRREQPARGRWRRKLASARSLEAIKRILLRESLNQPLIVIFEDLHWIDEETTGIAESARRLHRDCEDSAAG